MRVVVTGLIGTYPLGGVAWDYFQFVKGFAALGCDVTYLEDTGQWVYDRAKQTFTDDASANVAHLASVLGRVPGLEKSFAFRDPRGVVHGLGEAELRRRCRSADLFLNVSGAIWFRDEYRGARVTAYYDSDPLYTQAGVLAVESGGGSEDAKRTAGWFRSHDVFFTMAENIADPSCTIPRLGIDWKTTRQPITLDDWPVTFTPEASRFTTVMSWKTNPALPVVGGRVYGGKDVEFRRFVDLPSKSAVELEVALSGPAPREELASRGWRIADAAAISTSPESYRQYIGDSLGEWSIAKEAYAATRSGWFSCRSACYLAMGKPVVVQDTGFASQYPKGSGVWPFTTLEEATQALEAVRRQYRRECEGARATAEARFDATVVLEKLARDAGL